MRLSYFTWVENELENKLDICYNNKMKKEIEMEVLDFYYETGSIPKISDLSFSRYLVNKHVGRPCDYIRKHFGIEKPVFSKVYLGAEPSLEKQIEWFALTHNRMPTASDCGKNGLSSYSKFKKELGGINNGDNPFFDNIKAVLRSRMEIMNE